MGEYGHRLYQDDLWVDEVMTIHREAGVYTSPYPCPRFMQAVGIWEDYQVLLSNAGLDNFLTDEPAQFAKLWVWCRISSAICLQLTPWSSIKSIIILST